MCGYWRACVSEHGGLAHESNAVGSIFRAAVDGSIHSDFSKIGRSQNGLGGRACRGLECRTDRLYLAHGV